MKETLEKIPDDVLDKFVVGFTEDGVTLATTEGESELDMNETYKKYLKEYPQLDVIKNYIENIIKETKKEEPSVEPITSDKEN